MNKRKVAKVLRDARETLRGHYIKGNWVWRPGADRPELRQLIRNGKATMKPHPATQEMGVAWDPLHPESDLGVLSALMAAGSPNESCEVCAEGAVYVAAAKNGLSKAEADAVINRHLKPQLPENDDDKFISVPDFNDVGSTTEQDVIELFDRAIAAVETDE